MKLINDGRPQEDQWETRDWTC